MRVTKRDGTQEAVDIGKVVQRITRMCEMRTPTQGPLTAVDVQRLAIQVVQSIHDGIQTSELDTVTAEIAQPMALENPQYGDLAARVLVGNYHKNSLQALWTHFSKQPQLRTSPGLYRPLPENIAQMERELYYWTTRALWENSDPNGDPSPVVSPAVFLAACSGVPDRWVSYARDYQYDYPGFQLLEATYLQNASLLDATGKRYRRPVERPQHLLLRVALGIHIGAQVAGHTFPGGGYAGAGAARIPHIDLLLLTEQAMLTGNLNVAQGTYEMLSQLLFTHATPTLFHAGTMAPQMSSCYLLQPAADSMEGIYDFHKECAGISKWAGGIGSHVHNIRGHGAYIRGGNGYSNGIVGMLRVSNTTSEYVNQSGKRPGTHAVYVGLTHPDIWAFLQLKKQRGNEQERARHLFYALWVADEFMRCVVANANWHLICPDRFSRAYGRQLEDYYDARPSTKWVEQPNDEEYAFTYMYRRAVAEGHAVAQIPAQTLWREILALLQETGGPYICFRDNVNRKSNHQHLGTVKSSNLCTEIMEYSGPDETAVCNLASICLPKFVVADSAYGIAWELLRTVVRTAVYNLNQIIDRNFYPNEKTRRSNLQHRPIGIGVQGLADLFCLLGMPFDSAPARRLEFDLFERLSYWAIERSCELAQLEGAHARCKESPLGRGIFQWEMWEKEQAQLGRQALAFPLSMDWEVLRGKVQQYGVRNSMLLALMPTASTSTIMGMSPCFEPLPSLVYKRRNRTGETTYVNRHFVERMIREERWTPELRASLLLDRRGSIADSTLPAEVKALYRTVWDLPPKAITEASIVRAPFICQSQSLNQFMERPTANALNEVYVLAWSRGLKTASYYYRRLAPVDAQKIQVERVAEGEVCTKEEGCLSCGS